MRLREREKRGLLLRREPASPLPAQLSRQRLRPRRNPMQKTGVQKVQGVPHCHRWFRERRVHRTTWGA